MNMIQIRTLPFNSFQVNTCIIWDESLECVIIDPSFYSTEEQELFEKFIRENKLKPVRQLNTHCHVDHLPGVAYLKRKYDLAFSAHRLESKLVENAPLMGRLFGFELEPLDGIEQFVEDDELIHFGASELKALHVPGHSEGSLAYYSGSAEFVVTGDALFNRSIGRTDLPGGDYDTLIHSIKSRLFTLPEVTIVYPGHGPASSIGDELRENPFFS